MWSKQAVTQVLASLLLFSATSLASQLPIKQLFNKVWTTTRNATITTSVYIDDTRTLLSYMTCDVAKPPSRLDCLLSLNILNFDGTEETRSCDLTLESSDNYLLYEISASHRILKNGNVAIYQGEVTSTDYYPKEGLADFRPYYPFVSFPSVFKIQIVDMNSCEAVKSDIVLKSKRGNFATKSYDDHFDVIIDSPDCETSRCVFAYDLMGDEIKKMASFKNHLANSLFLRKSSDDDHFYYETTDVNGATVYSLVNSSGGLLSNFTVKRAKDEWTSFMKNNRLVQICKVLEDDFPEVCSENYFDNMAKYTSVFNCWITDEKFNIKYNTSFVIKIEDGVPKYAFLRIAKRNQVDSSEKVLIDFGNPGEKFQYYDWMYLDFYETKDEFCFAVHQAENFKHDPKLPSEKKIFYNVKCIKI